MHLLIAAALCLIATPALAQRVDTRTIDVQQAANGREHCRFKAVPDLHLRTGYLSDKGALAEWAHRAIKGDAWLHARFTPEQPAGQILKFEVMHAPAVMKAARARLTLDSKASPVAVTLTRIHPNANRWTITPGDGTALATAMRYIDTLGLTLLNAKGKPIASYQFQIGALQDIAEYPAIVQWRCTPAPRN